MKNNKLQKENVKHKNRSQGAEIWYRFRKNRAAVIGMIIILLLVILALLADVIFDYDTQIAGMNAAERLLPPSLKHPFGTDQMGRDLFCRVLYGTKYSLTIGAAAVLTSVVIGIPVGAIAGYKGGVVDDIFMRVVDIVSAVPSTLLGIVIVSAFGANMRNLVLAIGIAGASSMVRTTRAEVMRVKSQEFVEAARAIGLKEYSIIISHILPNCLSNLLVKITLSMATAIAEASALSFLGLGVPVPSPEWGALLSAGRKYIMEYSYLTLFPGLGIILTVLGLNLMGDGLRDAMDPKLRK